MLSLSEEGGRPDWMNAIWLRAIWPKAVWLNIPFGRSDYWAESYQAESAIQPFGLNGRLERTTLKSEKCEMRSESEVSVHSEM